MIRQLDFHEVVQQYVSGTQLGAAERALLQAVGDALVEADRPPYCAPQVRDEYIPHLRGAARSWNANRRVLCCAAAPRTRSRQSDYWRSWGMRTERGMGAPQAPAVPMDYVSDDNDDVGDTWDGDDHFGSSWNTGQSGGQFDTTVPAAPILVIPKRGSAVAPPEDAPLEQMRHLNGGSRYRRRR